MTPSLLLILSSAPAFAAGAQPAALPLSFAYGGQAWRSVTEGAGAVAWQGAGAEAIVVLRPGNGYAGISAPLGDQPFRGLMDVELSASAEGAVELCVSFSLRGEGVPRGAVWSVRPADGKPQRLAARLAPPLPAEGPLYLHVGARGEGVVRVSALSLLAEELPPLVDDSSVRAPLPPDWRPDGNLDARARRMGDQTELTVSVNGMEFSLVPEATGTLGGTASLTAMVGIRGTAPKAFRITGEFTDGAALEPREFPPLSPGVDHVAVRCQSLLPGAHRGKLIVSSGSASQTLPVTLTFGRAYPAFGTGIAEGNRVASRWQLREVRVAAAPTSTTEELVAQVAPLLDASPAIPIVYLDGKPGADALRGLVTALKGRAALYGCDYRPARPFAGVDPRSEADALVTTAREVSSLVRNTDLDAYVLSPVFDSSANQPGSAENALLDACLARGLATSVSGLVVAAPSLPAGGVLGESVNGRNVREASAFWLGLDQLWPPAGVQAALAAHQAALPILTSGVTGSASTDERLDALKVARFMALAAYAGATGVTFPERPRPGEIGLLRPDGSLSAAGVAVKQLSRELAAAIPVVRLWQGLPGSPGAPIVAVPFVRDTEAILVLWNNLSVTRRVTLNLTATPYSQHTLVLSRDDPFATRSYEGRFAFSKEAVQAKRQDVYLRLAPLQVVVVRFRLDVWTPDWLKTIEFTAAPRGGPQSIIDHDDRPWWKKLQDWAEGHE